MSNYFVTIRAKLILAGVFTVTLIAAFIALGSYAYNVMSIQSQVQVLAERQGNSLQIVLRAVNELIVTEGSSTASKQMAERGLTQFAENLSSFQALSAGNEHAELFKQISEKWAIFQKAGAAFLALKSISIEDDDTMIGFGAMAKNAEALDKDLVTLTTIMAEQHSGDLQSMLVVTALLVGFMLIGSLLFYAWMYRQITTPIKAMQQTITEIEQTGQLSKRVVVHSKDEVGQTSVVFNKLMDTMQATLSQVSRVVEGLAVGDFSRKVNADLRGDLLILKEGVNSSVENIQATMSGLNKVMESLSKGDFSERIHLNMNGEFKVSLDLATQAMQTLEKVLGQVDSVMNQVANSNLSGRISAKALGQLDSLTKNMNSSLEALSNAMRLVNRNAQLVATSANETSTAIGQISDGAQNQMHSIADVLNAVKQTSESVIDVAKHTNQASQQSKDANTLIGVGMQKMDEMIQIVNAIAVNSEKINKITEAIESIANKTNLLSLNAAIEAARAGEHGKGFSVVAEEVGKLASNSAQSSQEIAQLVQQAVRDARLAVQSAETVNAGMISIQAKTSETDFMLASISTALEQQSSSVEQITQNISGLDKIARSNAAAAEQITATVIELAQIADSTRKEVEKFAV